MKKIDYKKLKNFADLNNIGLSGVKNFDGSHEVIKEQLNSLANLKNIFPKVSEGRHKLTLEIGKTMNKEDFAVTRGRIISLNDVYYKDIDVLQAEYKNLVDKGWFVKGTDYRAIIHHEFGHVVDEIYKINSMEIACNITKLDKPETLKFIKENLSEYAFSFADGSEIISEVFADISKGNASKFSRKFYVEVLKIANNYKN